MEVLAGGYRQSPPYGPAINGVALMAGAGVDDRISKRISIRVFDVDWLGDMTDNPDCTGAGCPTSKKNLSLSSGVIFHF